MTCHIEKIQLEPIPMDHCIYASIIKNDDDGFCYCLTCKKGIMVCPGETHGGRWVSTHYINNKKCKKAHEPLLKDLKQQLSELRKNSIEHESSPIVEPIMIPTQSTQIIDVWNKLKLKPKLKDLMTGIENTCKSTYEMDSDNEDEFVFIPDEVFEYIIANNVGFKKHSEQLIIEKNQMERTHETKIATMQEQINTLNQQIQTLMTDKEQINNRVSLLENENNRYKTNPSLHVEDPQ